MTTAPSQDRWQCDACGELALVGDRRCVECGRFRLREFLWVGVGGLGLIAAIALMLLTN